MSRIAYVNGRYVPHRDAVIHIEDRGFQFADGIYEVIAVVNGHMVDDTPHYERMERSLKEIHLSAPFTRCVLKTIVANVVRLNRVTNGVVYLQITRGIAPRGFPFPKNATPSLIVTARPYNYKEARLQRADGVKAITHPDLRWKRPDIKSVSLLPSVLAKQKAVEAGAFEAILYDEEGIITEGSSSNVWIVTSQGTLCTPPANEKILRGITRSRLLTIAREKGYPFEEAPFSKETLYQAKEVFLSAATSCVVPIVEIDGKLVGNGKPGPVTTALMEAYTLFSENALILKETQRAQA